MRFDDVKIKKSMSIKWVDSVYWCARIIRVDIGINLYVFYRDIKNYMKKYWAIEKYTNISEPKYRKLFFYIKVIYKN